MRGSFLSGASASMPSRCQGSRPGIGGLPSRRRGIRVRIAVLVFSALAGVFVAEVALRVLALPGIDFNDTRYDEIVGTTRYPASILTYRNNRGACVRRRINSWGYADAEHEMEKPEGGFRIGFFGDSYTDLN